MSLPGVWFDAAVFVYAVGGPHRFRQPCQNLVAALGEGALDGHASVLVVQEVAHQRLRRTEDRAEATQVARDVAATCTLHDVTRDDLHLALDLFSRSSSLGAADAVHAAVAINRDVRVIVTPDTDFDGLPLLDRLDPDDASEHLRTGEP